MTGSIAGCTARLTVTGRSRTNAFSSAARRALGDAAHQPLEHGLLAGAELTGDRRQRLGEPLGDLGVEQLEGLEELGGDLGHGAALSHRPRTPCRFRAPPRGRGTAAARPRSGHPEREAAMGWWTAGLALSALLAWAAWDAGRPGARLGPGAHDHARGRRPRPDGARGARRSQRGRPRTAPLVAAAGAAPLLARPARAACASPPRSVRRLRRSRPRPSRERRPPRRPGSRGAPGRLAAAARMHPALDRGRAPAGCAARGCVQPTRAVRVERGAQRRDRLVRGRRRRPAGPAPPWARAARAAAAARPCRAGRRRP